MIIVLFDKGCKNIVAKAHFNGLLHVTDFIESFMSRYPEARYWEIFSEKEYNAKFE